MKFEQVIERTITPGVLISITSIANIHFVWVYYILDITNKYMYLPMNGILGAS